MNAKGADAHRKSAMGAADFWRSAQDRTRFARFPIRSVILCCALAAGSGVYAQDAGFAGFARATSVSGQVSRYEGDQQWVMTAGQPVHLNQLIVTGNDGFAHFEVAGGSSFDLLSNSRVIFRKNTASREDLLDVLGGRVRMTLRPSAQQVQLRVFCPVAMITTHQPSTIAIAVDEDDTTRIDVMEGEIRVTHRLLPRGEPVEVKAIDAIMVQRDQPISRQVERGSLYRYTLKSLRDLWIAITPGHSPSNQWLAARI